MLSNHSNSQNNTDININTDNSIDAPRHFVGSLNTRRIGKIHRIRLTKSYYGGFGIKIAERDNMFGTERPIYITAITTTGSAYSDGRLKEGDMILKINGQDLSGLSQASVTKMLKEVPTTESVEFVISRQADQDTHNPDIRFEEKIDDILNMPIVDGPGIFIFDIPLKNSAGLGLYLKYPRNQSKQDLGIWIDKVLHEGAAWYDRRLQPNDQILAINGIELVGFSNSEATKILKAAVSRGIGPEARPNTIRLKIHRRNPKLVASILYPTSNITSSPSNSSSDGEGEFVRDSFARKSISEKRHSQTGKNTRNYKRIQKQLNQDQNSQIEPKQIDDIEYLYYNLQLHYPPRPIPRSNSFIAAIDNNKLSSSSSSNT